MTDAIAIHEAYKRGDLDALKAALGDPPDFPNSRGPSAVGEIILEYAIYHSPLDFIDRLLDLGADPNYGDHAGFPSLIAALSSGRPDVLGLVEALLGYGADIEGRGVNGYTPLHYAAAGNDVKAVELLLARGADAAAKTSVDDFNTPLEEAESLGSAEAAAVLRAYATDEKS